MFNPRRRFLGPLMDEFRSGLDGTDKQSDQQPDSTRPSLMEVLRGRSSRREAGIAAAKTAVVGAALHAASSLLPSSSEAYQPALDRLRFDDFKRLAPEAGNFAEKQSEYLTFEPKGVAPVTLITPAYQPFLFRADPVFDKYDKGEYKGHDRPGAHLDFEIAKELDRAMQTKMSDIDVGGNLQLLHTMIDSRRAVADATNDPLIKAEVGRVQRIYDLNRAFFTANRARWQPLQQEARALRTVVKGLVEKELKMATGHKRSAVLLEEADFPNVEHEYDLDSMPPISPDTSSVSYLGILPEGVSLPNYQCHRVKTSTTPAVPAKSDSPLYHLAQLLEQVAHDQVLLGSDRERAYFLNEARLPQLSGKEPITVARRDAATAFFKQRSGNAEMLSGWQGVLVRSKAIKDLITAALNDESSQLIHLLKRCDLSR